PHCGPDTIEVVCFLAARSMERGAAVPTSPEGNYTVILYCHSCGRAAALDLSRGEGENHREAAELPGLHRCTNQSLGIHGHRHFVAGAWRGRRAVAGARVCRVTWRREGARSGERR